MRSASLLVGSLAVLTLTGCATNGRRVLLKEYAPTLTGRPDSPLKGATICLVPFQEEFNIKEKAPTDPPNEPPPFPFVKMADDAERSWNAEVEARVRSSSERDWKEIGNLRNGFGMIMSQVYAVNPVNEWLRQALKLDLEAAGAKVVDASQAADAVLTVDGVIRYFKIDIYMAYKADLVVALQLKRKDKPVTPVTLYTRAGQTAWSGSSYEFFQSIRLCQQKFSRVLIAEIEKVLQP